MDPGQNRGRNSCADPNTSDFGLCTGYRYMNHDQDEDSPGDGPASVAMDGRPDAVEVLSEGFGSAIVSVRLTI